MAEMAHSTTEAPRNAATPAAMMLPPNSFTLEATTLPTSGSIEPDRMGAIWLMNCAMAPTMPMTTTKNAVLFDRPVKMSSLLDMPYS